LQRHKEEKPMAHISEKVRETEYTLPLALAGLTRFHQGKVRDSWRVPGLNNAFLVVATDRLSIFDFVLTCVVPRKGEVLTALTYFWMTQVLKNFPNHLRPSEIKPGHNYIHDVAALFSGIPLRRALVVQQMLPPEFELIFRHHIGGSVYKRYLETGRVWDYELPAGLPKWSKLDSPIFTPSTKAATGHDVNISPAEYYQKSGEEGRKAAELVGQAYAVGYSYAAERGVLILDTKGEARRLIDATAEASPVIGDEFLTPDSSRFVLRKDFEVALAEGREPDFFDKEPVRILGRGVETPWGVGIHKLDPENDEHLAFVDDLEVPADIIAQTSERYLDIFAMLTGKDLDTFQREDMGIAA
jgi:phosphoribosylaminoimidazole-succinocarboxamide synthase